MALTVIAASLAIMAVRLSEPDREAHEGTADRAGTVLSHRDAPLPAATAKGEDPGAHRIDQTPRASTTAPPLLDSRVRRGGEVKNGFYLIGRGSVVVVAADEATALRLRRRPRNVSELIRQGSVFSVPTGTAVKILARNAGLDQVRILESAMAGRDGWIHPGQLVVRRQP
jgi:hypothetical protein